MEEGRLAVSVSAGGAVEASLSQLQSSSSSTPKEAEEETREEKKSEDEDVPLLSTATATVESPSLAKWPERLASPVNLAAFSPSTSQTTFSRPTSSTTTTSSSMPGASNNLFGTGLQLATERSKNVNVFLETSLAPFLLNIASRYDAFGVRLIQAASAVAVDGSSDPSKQPPLDNAQLVKQKFQSLAMDFQKTSQHYQQQLVPPLRAAIKANSSAMHESILTNKKSVQDSVQARQHALSARQAYQQQVQTAEMALLQWAAVVGGTVVASTTDQQAQRESNAKKEEDQAVEKEADVATITLDVPPWQQALIRFSNKHNNNGDQQDSTAKRDATNHLVKQLEQVLTLEQEYVQLVQKENQAVRNAQQAEHSALQTCERGELERTRHVYKHVIPHILDWKLHSTERLPTPTKTATTSNSATTFGTSVDDDINAIAAEIEKKGKDLFANLFNNNNNNSTSMDYETGMGVMDAETLGLPNEVGILRDDLKTTILAGQEATKTVEQLITCLKEASEGVKLLQQALRKQSRKSSEESLQSLAEKSMGARTGILVNDVVKVYQQEAALLQSLYDSLLAGATALKGKLRDAVNNNNNTSSSSGWSDVIKVEDETDDNNWRQLCEAARAESRAETKYKNTQQQQEKARERILSTGDASIGDDTANAAAATTTSEEKQPPARQGRLLKVGGRMKKLQENARLAMAQKNLNEAEQRIDKEKQIYEKSMAAKKKAIQDYKAVTVPRLEKIKHVNQQGRQDVQGVMQTVVQQLQTTTTSRRENLVKSLHEMSKQHSLAEVMADADDWVQSTCSEIQDKVQQEAEKETNRTPNHEGGYQLEVVRVKSKRVYEILSLTGKEECVKALEFDADELAAAAAAATANRKLEEASAAPSVPSLGVNSKSNSESSLSESHKESDDVVVGNETTSDALTHNFQEQRDDDATFRKEFEIDATSEDEVPKVLQVINCTYRVKEKASFLVPALHGRLYTTTAKIYFLAWDGGKKFALDWSCIVSIRKEKGFMGQNKENTRSIVVTYTEEEAAESQNTSSSFILGKLERVDETLTHLLDIHTGSSRRQESQPANKDEKPSTRNLEVAKELPPVPPDEMLKKMQVVLTKMIRGTSIQKFYEQVWSEGNSTSAEPFYRNFLDKEGCFECMVNDWETTGQDDDFVNPWCKEAYPQRRYVTFKFKRTSHLYIGPPVAFVKQMQYCRVEKNDKCIMSISATFEGIPYSDTFGVEMRWVARRVGLKDIQIDVGLFVDFKKATMLKSQIKAGTISETKNVHLRLFQAAAQACSTDEEREDKIETHIVEETGTSTEETVNGETSASSSLWGMLSSVPISKQNLVVLGVAIALPISWALLSRVFFASGGASLSSNDVVQLNQRIDDLQAEVKALKESIDILVTLVAKKNQ